MRARKDTSIPILMYHSISDGEPSDEHPYYRTSTPPAIFAAQMRYVHENGFQTVSPTAALTRLVAGEDVSKLIVITFDDGYRDFYINAAPVLSQLGFTATVFLPTAYIGKSTLEFRGRACLTWPEVRELQRIGFSFGSHTVTHPQLQYLDSLSIKREVVASKEMIEEQTDRRVDSFAYPYAFPQADRGFKNRLRELLSSAGYQSGVSTIVGRLTTDSDPLFIQRLPINNLDDTPLFKAKLAGAYDWMGIPQIAYKAVKSWVPRARRK